MQDMQELELKRTECFAVEEAERERIWQEEYGSKMDVIISRINSLLKKDTDESRLELQDMFYDKDFFEHYKQTDIVAIMYIVIQIYEKERLNHIYPTILGHGKTVEELQRYLEQFKFILYRVDFAIDSKSEQELIEYIRKYQMSTITIETMITTCAMRPIELVLKMEHIFEKNFMYKELFSIRNYINERWQGNHRILYKLAELYEKAGYEEYAQECTDKIPDKLRVQYEIQNSMLQVQENLWKLRYKDMTSVETIVRILQAFGISIETWELLLMCEAVEEEEYYLILAEVFLKKNLLSFAVKTLEIGALIIPQNDVINALLEKCEMRMR